MNEAPRLFRPRPSWPILLALGFLAGVFADRRGWLPGRRNAQPARLGKTFAPFWEAWHKVEQHYVDRTKVDDVNLTRGAIRGMLRALGDEGHTTYLSPEERKKQEEALSGQTEGIGTDFRRVGKQVVVARALPGSPAEAASVRPGDVIVAIDGKPADKLSEQALWERSRGRSGSEVKLRVRGKDGEREVTLTRARIEVPEVTWQLLPGLPGLAQVHVRAFSDLTADQLRKALAEARSAGAKGIVLDLRNNRGGRKEQAVRVAAEFLPAGTTVCLQENAKGEREALKTGEGGQALDLPLCVLVNRSSASAAEILTGALQDHGRARVVGLRTYGTGTILKQFPLSDGGAVRLAVYQWLTPKGNKPWRVGIKPNEGLEVPLPPGGRIVFPRPGATLTEADLEASKDHQLRAAIDVLRKGAG
jgi:carboxyl-terminal processing protease